MTPPCSDVTLCDRGTCASRHLCPVQALSSSALAFCFHGYWPPAVLCTLGSSSHFPLCLGIFFFAINMSPLSTTASLLPTHGTQPLSSSSALGIFCLISPSVLRFFVYSLAFPTRCGWQSHCGYFSIMGVQPSLWHRLMNGTQYCWWSRVFTERCVVGYWICCQPDLTLRVCRRRGLTIWLHTQNERSGLPAGPALGTQWEWMKWQCICLVKSVELT